MSDEPEDAGRGSDETATDGTAEGGQATQTSDLAENVSDRFDRLAPTDAQRSVAGRPSRQAVLEWWSERYGIEPEVFEDYTFWEKGNGKLWALTGDAADPSDVEALGMTFLRTRQEHWKPTTDAVQRFGHHASENVIDLTAEEARRFAAGEDQAIERWDGDWGYLIAAQDLADERAILGVGLYVHGELRSMVPKGRRRDV